jgi:hypothetical protein
MFQQDGSRMMVSEKIPSAKDWDKDGSENDRPVVKLRRRNQHINQHEAKKQLYPPKSSLCQFSFLPNGRTVAFYLLISKKKKN